MRHAHLAVHRHRSRKLIACLLAVAGAHGQLAEAEVAVRDERAHAELAGKSLGLAVVPERLVALANRSDGSRQAEGLGLASTSSQAAGERQCFSSVAGGFVYPSSQQVRRARTQHDESRPRVNLAPAKLLDRV